MRDSTFSDKLTKLLKKRSVSCASTAIEQEELFLATLESIDFDHSKLPERVLAARLDPTDNICELEYGVLMIIQDVQCGPIAVGDTAAIDERLNALAERLSVAVKEGYAKGAYIAKGALVKCVADFRRSIPKDNTEKKADFYIESICKYIDCCIALTDIALVSDALTSDSAVQGTAKEFAQILSEAIIDTFCFELDILSLAFNPDDMRRFREETDKLSEEIAQKENELKRAMSAEAGSTE